jgi:hypothetical protein
MVSTRKLLFSSVHRACVTENTLSIAALVSGMANENSKMSCLFLTKCIHFAQTRIFQTTFQKLWFCIPFIHSGFTYICNMNKFIRYVTLSNSSKICCMTKGGPRHLLQGIYILFDHMKTFPRAIFLTLRMYNPWIERMISFYYVECEQSFGCNMFTLIGYSFFGKIRRYILL